MAAWLFHVESIHSFFISFIGCFNWYLQTVSRSETPTRSKFFGWLKHQPETHYFAQLLSHGCTLCGARTVSILQTLGYCTSPFLWRSSCSPKKIGQIGALSVLHHEFLMPMYPHYIPIIYRHYISITC